MDLVDNARLDAVEHAGENGPGRLPDDAEDGDGDKQPDDRVGKRKAQPHAERTGDDGEAGKAVGAGVIAVRDQRGAVDLAADADAKHRDRLVAEKADDAGGGEPAEMRRRLRMDQAVDRLVARDDRAEQDDAAR